ncbi:MAG TPA: cobalt ECF transporter T component CbiQ [Anaerolineales bacterium]|nr:cobalt ECF transporter T component CbiQ [Anaerolineales bacterium]
MHIDLTDQYHHRESLIHHLDPRVKVVVTLFFILVVGLVRNGSWISFGALFLMILGYAAVSRLGVFYAVRRSIIAIPFLLAAAPLPFIIPGPALISFPALNLTISEPGTIRFVSILLRTFISVQAGILLAAATPFPDLVWGMCALRIPRPLVAVIAFMYRYIIVLADEALRLMRARTSRSPEIPGKGKPSLIWRGRVTGSMVGSLFLRSLDRSERIYGAMASRGYDGDMRSYSTFHMRGSDWSSLIVFSLLILGSLSLMFLR